MKQPSENKNALEELDLKISPEALILRRMGANVSLDAGELARAQWFWKRRPKMIIRATEKALEILTFYGSIWLVAACLKQHTLEMTALVGLGSTIVVAMPSWAYLDSLRFARWSLDYRSAIFRLLQTAHR